MASLNRTRPSFPQSIHSYNYNQDSQKVPAYYNRTGPQQYAGEDVINRYDEHL